MSITSSCYWRGLSHSQATPTQPHSQAQDNSTQLAHQAPPTPLCCLQTDPLPPSSAACSKPLPLTPLFALSLSYSTLLICIPSPPTCSVDCRHSPSHPAQLQMLADTAPPTQLFACRPIPSHQAVACRTSHSHPNGKCAQTGPSHRPVARSHLLRELFSSSF